MYPGSLTLSQRDINPQGQESKMRGTVVLISPKWQKKNELVHLEKWVTTVIILLRYWSLLPSLSFYESRWQKNILWSLPQGMVHFRVAIPMPSSPHPGTWRQAATHCTPFRHPSPITVTDLQSQSNAVDEHPWRCFHRPEMALLFARFTSLAWIKAQALVCCSRWILSLSHALHIGQFLLRDSFLSQLAQQDLKSWAELLIIYIQCTSRLPVDGLLPGLLHRACYISFDPWFDVLSCPPGLEWLKWILTFVPRT